MDGGSQQLVGQLQVEVAFLVTKRNPSSCCELFLETQRRLSSSSPFSNLASHWGADCKFLSDEVNQSGSCLCIRILREPDVKSKLVPNNSPPGVQVLMEGSAANTLSVQVAG